MKPLIVSLALVLFSFSISCQNTEDEYLQEGRYPHHIDSSVSTLRASWNTSWSSIYAEDGLCYADAYESDLYEFDEQEYYVFTGKKNQTNRKYLRTISHLKMIEPRSKWTKINYGSNDCLSADPMDCLSRRRRNSMYGIRIITSIIVTDTMLVKDYEKKLLTKIRLIESRTGIKKVQVLCEYELTSAVKKKINKRLIETGYLSPGLKRQVIDALYRYQIRHGLPLGYFDYETLAHLKVL